MASTHCRLPEDTPEVLALWKSFRATGNRASFESLCVHYLPAVRFHARRALPRDQSPLELDDLISAGSIALIEAINKFDPDGTGSFATFSWKIIRRTMLDELARYRWQPSTHDRREKLLAKVESRIVQREGRPASDGEIIEAAIKLPEWDRKRFGVSIRAVHPITTSCACENDAGSLVEDAAAPLTSDPAMRAERRELRARLLRGFDGIDRRIVRRFLLGGELMKSAAHAIGIDRTTVNHRLKAILLKLSFRTDLADLSGISSPRFGDPQFNTLSNRAA